MVTVTDQDLDIQEFSRLYLVKVAATISPFLYLFLEFCHYPIKVYPPLERHWIFVTALTTAYGRSDVM